MTPSDQSATKDEVAFIWGGPLPYDFGPGHPLQPVRVELAVDLIRSYLLLDRPNVHLLGPRQASDEDLRMIHSAEFVAAVKRAGRVGDPLTYLPEVGLGPGDNPVFPGMHEASALIAGGSLRAADFLLQDQAGEGARHAFAIGGGLHHAMRGRASGFCVYNDAALAVERLRRQGLRVLYVDTDAHHGDGVQEAFYEADDVLTVSLHESGRFLFPGTGFEDETGAGQGRGYAVNVPLPPGVGDTAYRLAFDRLVPPLAHAFKPDVIVNQNGVDAHQRDPLAHLRLSIGLYAHVARTIHALAHELCHGRWLALGGGGYDLYDAVPRAWALVFAEMVGETLPADLPEVWLHLLQARGFPVPARSLLEPPTDSDEQELRQVGEIVRRIRRSSPLLEFADD